MRNNPLYFAAVFGRDASIDAEAARLFRDFKRLDPGGERKRKRRYVSGYDAIAKYLGITKSQVIYVMRRKMLKSHRDGNHRRAVEADQLYRFKKSKRARFLYEGK